MNKCLFYFCACKPVGNWRCQRPLLSHSQRPDRDGGSLSVTDGPQQAAAPQARSPRSQLWTLSGICSSFSSTSRAWQCFATRHRLWSVSGGKLSGGAVIFFSLCCSHAYVSYRKLSSALLPALPLGGRKCHDLEIGMVWCIFTDLWACCLRMDNALTPRCVSAAYVWCIGWPLVIT